MSLNTALIYRLIFSRRKNHGATRKAKRIWLEIHSLVLHFIYLFIYLLLCIIYLFIFYLFIMYYLLINEFIYFHIILT